MDAQWFPHGPVSMSRLYDTRRLPAKVKVRNASGVTNSSVTSGELCTTRVSSATARVCHCHSASSGRVATASSPTLTITMRRRSAHPRFFSRL